MCYENLQYFSFVYIQNKLYQLSIVQTGFFFINPYDYHFQQQLKQLFCLSHLTGQRIFHFEEVCSQAPYFLSLFQIYK